MDSRPDLLQLAGLIGIETRYTDALGRTREVSDDTLVALIAAFGLPPDPQQARDELAAHNCPPLGLAAVHVLRAENLHPELALRPPAHCSSITWICRLEDGA